MYSVPPPRPPQAPLPIHKTKLVALIVGAVVLVGMILPWASITGGLGARSSGNGFQGWGILSLFGLIAVVVSSLAGDKLSDYDQNMRYLAIGAFSAISLGALISFMQMNGNAQFGISVKAGIGVWFTLIAGVLGLLWVTGVIKLNSSPKPYSGYNQQPPYYNQPQQPHNYPPQYPQHPNQPPPNQQYPPQNPNQYPPQQQPPHQTY